MPVARLFARQDADDPVVLDDDRVIDEAALGRAVGRGANRGDPLRLDQRACERFGGRHGFRGAVRAGYRVQGGRRREGGRVGRRSADPAW
jgi:hypothetical protein